MKQPKYCHCGLDPQSHDASIFDEIAGQARNDNEKLKLCIMFYYDSHKSFCSTFFQKGGAVWAHSPRP